MRNNSDEIKQSYSEKLKDPRWQKKRLEIMQRDKFRCKLCGDATTSLQVHHKEYINGNAPWEYDKSQLITLCEHCHYEIEYLIFTKLDFNINDVSIFKNNTWSSGSRIMWISIPGRFIFRIYNGDKDFIFGGNISSKNTMNNVIKILKKSLNGI